MPLTISQRLLGLAGVVAPLLPLYCIVLNALIAACVRSGVDPDGLRPMSVRMCARVFVCLYEQPLKWCEHVSNSYCCGCHLIDDDDDDGVVVVAVALLLQRYS